MNDTKSGKYSMIQRAKISSGKTLAFLLPILRHIADQFIYNDTKF